MKATWIEWKCLKCGVGGEGYGPLEPKSQSFGECPECGSKTIAITYHGYYDEEAGKQ